MSETSQLVEKIPEALKAEEEFFVEIVDSLSGRKYETSVKLKSPYEFDLTRFIPTDQITGLPEFFNLADQIIRDAQDREGIIADARVLLKEDFNVDEFSQHGEEVITWRVIKREPANMDTKAQSRPQRRTLFDYNLRSAQYPNKVIIVESRPVDHVIEFSCWSSAAQLANSRALWLERLFIDHSWAFTVKGVERFYWTGRGSDSIQAVGGNRLHQRPLRFFARFREFHTVAHPAIKNFTFEVNTSDQT
jgi:hypothetical protein